MQASKEEIHWWSQAVTNNYSNNNEHISHHGQNVGEQEQNKKSFLHLWILWEAQEDKVSYIAPWFHLLFYWFWFHIWEDFYLQNNENIFREW